MTRDVHELSQSSVPLIDGFDLLMLDLDGVVYVGADPVDGAGAAVRKAHEEGVKLAYVTNNASRTPQDVAARLRDMGMPLTSDADIVTAAQAAAHMVADLVPEKSQILVVGGEGLYAALEERGLQGVATMSESTAAVVQGFSPELDWALLAEGAYAVHAGLPWVASNLDRTFPTERGLAPGNGSLVQTITNATGAYPMTAGKPERALFDETTERVGGSRPLVVGDRLDTDIEGANNIGAPSLAVLTGVTGVQDIADAEPRRRPTFVAADLNALFVAHPQVTHDGEDCVCGAARVRQRDGTVCNTVAGADPMHVLRASIALAWSHHAETGVHLRLDDDGRMDP